ncbi:MAG: energy transducer TonB [Anaeromyxobacter sp.]
MFETVLHRDSEYHPALSEPLPVHHPALSKELFGDVLHDDRRQAPVLMDLRVHVPPPGFEGARKRDLGARSGKRLAWTSASTAFQVLVVVAIGALATGAAQRLEEVQPLVPVKLVTAKAAVPPPPPPPAAAPMVKRSRPLPPDAKVVKAAPPGALIQPKEVAEEMKAQPDEPYEELPEATGEGDGEGGVIGGVVAPPPPPEPTNEVEEAPRWMTTGYKKPVESEPGCVGRSVRLPRELAGFVSGALTVKFAVLSNGTVDKIEVMQKLPDARINEAIAAAVRSCKFTPGADATGRPTAISVILPLRFTAS